MSTSNRRRMAFRAAVLSVLAFLIMLSYSIARPATESLFLETHTVDDLPYVWIVETVVVVFTALGFSRLLARVELLRLFGVTAAASALALAALQAARVGQLPFADYALYIWKDIYIVLLVEAFYCYANAVFPMTSARWLYGLFGIVSSVGSLVGNLAVGVMAEAFGTAIALWVVAPICVVIWAICVPFSRVAGVTRPEDEAGAAPVGLGDIYRVLRGSSYVLLLVVLIAVVQVVVNLVDYEFNWVVQQSFPETDHRTAVIGQVYATLSLATIILHSLTGPILRLAGVPIVLLSVPILLGAGLGAFMISPTFITGAVLKIASKCFDYTIFRAAKEMLYIPLTYDEKTQGKSIVDVLSYRVAKGGASALLIGIQSILAVVPFIGLVFLVSPLALAFVLVWIALTAATVKRFRRKVSREQEMKG